MPANNPLANAVPGVQGPDPTGNAGYPIAVVPATGSGNFPVQVQAGGAAQPVTVADGSDVAEGATTDVAVAGDVAGTVSAKLRQLNKIFTTVADLTNLVLGAKIGGSSGLFAAVNTALGSSGTATDFLNTLAITGPTGAVTGNPAGNTVWEMLRTPKIFKTVTVTAAGNTAVWTPATGKKFRLMRYRIQVTANASLAVAGLLEVTLQDATTAIGLGHSFFVPAAAGTAFGEQDGVWIDIGNGILSAAANNVLNINLSVALATGECRIIACGTEE